MFVIIMLLLVGEFGEVMQKSTISGPAQRSVLKYLLLCQLDSELKSQHSQPSSASELLNPISQMYPCTM